MSVGITVGTALAIGGGLAAAGGVASSLIGSSAAKSAASVQAKAADTATQLQKDEFNQQQSNIAPWLQAGGVSLNQLMSGLQPGGALSTPFSGTFTAPTEAEARATPGYQFTADQGSKAILNAQTASGGAFTGGTAKSLDAFNTGLADSTYNDSFNRALQTFGTQFNTYNTNQSNLFNKLASVSGLGQTSAVQLGQLGQQAASNEGNLLTSGAASTAAGGVGSANAVNSGISSISNNLNSSLLLASLMKGGISPVTAASLNPSNPAFSAGSGDSTATLGFPFGGGV